MAIMKAALLTASATAFTAASIKQRASRTLLRAESALETLPEGENPSAASASNPVQRMHHS